MNTAALEHLETHLRRVEFALDPSASADDVAAMERQAAQIEAENPEPEALPLRTLCADLELTPFHRDALLLASSSVLHPTLGQRVGLSPGAPWTCGLLADTLAPHLPTRLAVLDWFDDASPLFAAGLLRRAIPDDGLLSAPFLHPVVVPWHWIAFLCGQRRTGLSEVVVERIVPTVTLDQVVLAASLRDEIRRVFRSLCTAAPLDEPQVQPEALDFPRGVAVLLLGLPGNGRALLARALVNEIERPALILRGTALATERRARDLLDLVVEQSQFFDEPLIVRDADVLWQRSPDLANALALHVRRRRLVAILTGQKADLGPDLGAVVAWRQALPSLSPESRRQLWEINAPGALSLAPDVNLTRLACTPLTGQEVALALASATRTAPALAQPDGEPPLVEADQPHLETWISRVTSDAGHWSQSGRTTAKLETIVLHEDTRRQLDRVVRSVRVRRRVLEDWGFGRIVHRGNGITCLFDGEPGTGKTLTAEALANETGLTLRLVNVASVVDKYIGETEKNLARVFSQADPDRDLLLFDEADALFSKRTEVTRSTDRYANLEINALLQLVERHQGVVVLTTNLKDQIDPAFERRLMFKVRFEVPTADLREMLWRRHLGPGAPVQPDVDFGLLARRFELAGGAIKNAVLRAAYAAAAVEGPITQQLLLEMAREEAIAAGHLVRDDFAAPTR